MSDQLTKPLFPPKWLKLLQFLSNPVGSGAVKGPGTEGGAEMILHCLKSIEDALSLSTFVSNLVEVKWIELSSQTKPLLT